MRPQLLTLVARLLRARRFTTMTTASTTTSNTPPSRTPSSSTNDTRKHPHKPKIVLILGPTGTGKSSLALRLAQTFPAEILNIDAMQLYTGLPVITNKVSPSDRAAVPHHLLDMIPLEARPWTVHRFVKEAEKVISEVVGRGKTPVLVGGTGYYAFGLLVAGGTLGDNEGGGLDEAGGVEEGISENEGANGGSRLEREDGTEEAKRRWPILAGTSEEMYAELQRLDPAMAETWHPKDWRRVQRSLEICLRTGKRVSEIYRAQEVAEQAGLTTRGRGGVEDHNNGVETGEMLRYDPLILWLQAEDRVLKERLDARVGDMVQSGLFEEVVSMQKYEAEQRANGVEIDKTKGIWVSIGYKEMEPWATEHITNPQPLEEAKQSPLAKACIEAVQAGTRRYAKRQERYIRVSFAKALQRAGATDRLLLLDGTDLSKFYSELVPQAEELTGAFLVDKKLPDPSSLSELARQMFAKIRDESPQRSMRVKRYCEVCDRTMMTDHEWNTHMSGRGHKKVLQGRKKHEQKLKYLAGLAEKREAPEVDVAS